MDDDVLQPISDEDLPLLCDLYEARGSEVQHVHIFLRTCLRWNKAKSGSFRLYGIDGDWLKSGNIIIVMQLSCCYIFLSSLEDDCNKLCAALTRTGRMDWTKTVIWYTISTKDSPAVFDILKELQLPTYHHYSRLWSTDREKALEYDIKCPDEVYVGNLDSSHVKFIEDRWPHRYEGSDRYVAKLIEMNNSYGLFLKNDDTLVCWVMRNQMGQIGVLQTLPEHTRKGYGVLVTKMMAKEIAEDGFNPIATVVKGNVASEKMFERMGFRVIDDCVYIESYGK